MELKWAEWLCYIIVGSELKPEYLVEFLAFGSQHDNRSSDITFPQFLANLQSIQLRQHKVENDDIEIQIHCLFKPFRTCRRRIYLIAFKFKIILQGHPDGPRIF